MEDFQVLKRITDYGRMIKFSHTIFALPFALSAVVLAWKSSEPSVMDLLWILVAMAGARSAAMGFNRIVDADFDQKNPRTANREIPKGVLSRKQAMVFAVVSGLVFVFAAAMLSFLCFVLSFPVLFVLCFYSCTKRFTSFCHVFLGFAIGLAPAGTWIALTGSFHWGIVWLCLALLTYIAGFDILYSCMDAEFDREQGLFSIPVRFGLARAMILSCVLHVCTVGFLLVTYYSFSMHPVFLIFLAIIVLLLVAEHWMVNPRDLSRIHTAFFHMNSLVSICLFLGVLTQFLLSS